MLIETIVTLFIAGFVAIAGYGHLLVARALLGHKDGAAETAREHEAEAVRHDLLRRSEWMTHASLAAIVIASVLLAAPATAADGEVLIDQAAAIAGGITPGDEPGYPVTLSRPGKYKLTGSLRVPPNRNGIEITADNVTIDFNGFTMGGRGLALNGILANFRDSITVMNGTIGGFHGTGIRSGVRAVIENMWVLSVDNSAVFLGDQSRVSNSTVSGNAGFGIFCGLGCLIEQNVIADNLGIGIDLKGGGMALGNVIMSNASFGIFVLDDVPAGYAHNTLAGNNADDPGLVQVAGNLLKVHPNACEPVSSLCP
jgi:hypothetical protein